MLKKFFPSDLASYIPGRKLIAGLVTYILLEAFGASGDLVNLPVIGEVNVTEAATLVAVYLWPEN